MEFWLHHEYFYQPRYQESSIKGFDTNLVTTTAAAVGKQLRVGTTKISIAGLSYLVSVIAYPQKCHISLLFEGRD